jgi:lincosamide nucleotidyltransferase B/F
MNTVIPTVDTIRKRLNELVFACSQIVHTLAVVGIGSTGPESDRLDRFSDLDLFLVVRKGNKSRFLHDLTWLTTSASLCYAFRRTADEYKILFTDGVFCELGVFEPEELHSPSFTQGDWAAPKQVLWHAPAFDPTVLEHAQVQQQSAHEIEWLLGEALTNLLVGLGRYYRGEKLSAMRFIQTYTFDRIVELSHLLEQEQPVSRDTFSPERRYEQRFPLLAQSLPEKLQGYTNSIASAQAMLLFLDHHFTINQEMKAQIQALCDRYPLPELAR